MKYKNGRPDEFFKLVERGVLSVLENGFPEQVEMQTSEGVVLVLISKVKLPPMKLQPKKRARK